jgi:hypothetical protein
MARHGKMSQKRTLTGIVNTRTGDARRRFCDTDGQQQQL